MTSNPDPLPPTRSSDQTAVDLAIRLGALGLLAYVVLLLLRPFLGVLLWSGILTVAFYPVFGWLRDRLGGRSWLASLVLTSFAVGIVVGPAALLAASLVHTVETFGRRLGTGRHLELPAPPPALAEIPVAGETLSQAWQLASSNLEAFLARYGRFLLDAGEWMLHAAAGLAESLAAILVAVIVSGFLLGPAPRLMRTIRRLADRIAGGRGSEFVDLAGVTIRNVARGVIGVALIQALVIGLGLIIGAVPGAGLLTLAVLILGILQIGAVPVVAPLLIWAWFSRETGPALLLTLYMIPAALSDNVLKPLLMGKGLAVPMLVILVGVIGGSLSYGLVGLFVGPVVLAVFYELLAFWIAAAPEEAEPRGGIE